MPVEEYLAGHKEIEQVEAPYRLEHLAGPMSGDILLLSNYADGFYFANPMPGMHGGLHPHDSLCVASLGWAGANEKQVSALQENTRKVLMARMKGEKRNTSSLADLAHVLAPYIG